MKQKVFSIMLAMLISMAANVVMANDGQFAKRQNAKKAQAQQKSLPAVTQKHYQVAGMKSFEALNCETAKMGKKFKMGKQAQSMVAAPKMKAAAAKFKAAAVQAEYNAKGYQVTNDSLMTWVMKSSSINDTLLLSNVLPNVFGFEEGVLVEYTLSDNKIVIKPQLIASNEDKTMFVFLESATTNDGVITLTLNDDGTIADKYSILYGAYDGSDYASAKYLGWYGCYAKNITYRVPGQIVKAPQVEYQPNNLVLFAGLGLSGYSYNDNLALIGAYAPLSFINNTKDDATGWDWSVLQTTGSEESKQTVAIRGTEKDFTFNTVADAVYENLALVGIIDTEKSDSVKWGFGKTLSADSTVRYKAMHAYAGGYGSQFGYSDGTYATMTTQDPDGDLTFYTNWGTPDKASNEMSKIYVYQGKPSSPLYFEGVTLPLIGFEEKENFNLHIAIRKCMRDSQTGKITLGDIVAEADATSENVNTEYKDQSGFVAIEFNKLYVEDEFGLSEEIDYLFMEEEFLIEIDGWNNGTFSGVLGSQDITPANGLTTTWFEMAGEPGSTYSYTSWKTSLFVGLIEPAYGYLYTTDKTRVEMNNAGGEAKIHVKPMLTSKDDQGKPTYRLFIEKILVDGEVAEDLPEWLTFQIVNEDYNEESEHYGEYDLIVKAAAMPAEIAGREVTITFRQEGALLPVTVVQKLSVVYIDSLNVADLNIEAGESNTQEISLVNDHANLVGFQMDLTLPEGVGIDKTGCTLSSRITDEEQVLTIGKLESGAYRITSTSLSLTPISGNNGTLLNLKLTAAEGCIGGKATISNIIFSTAESEKVIMSDKTFDISILYNLTYKVDGEEYKTSSVVYGAAITPEAEPTKDGHTFSGWSEIPETMPANDVVITGTFKINSYLLTYIVDGEVYKKDSIVYASVITPIDEPVKEGYTFTGWSEIPETMPSHDVEISGDFFLYGDVNTDEAVDVVDVVDIARFVVATPSVNFREKLADLNFDKTVNIADAVTLVNFIAGDQNFSRMMTPSRESYDYDLCQLQLLGNGSNALSLCLDGAADFTAFQFEVELPENTDITAMSINGQRMGNHKLLYNKVGENRYRVAALSLSNAIFKGNAGELLNISIDGLNTNEVSVQNIHFVTKNGKDITFDALALSGIVTGIANVRSNESNDVIFDLQGRKLSKTQRGVNIINGKKVIVNK